jgi:hypothetical protein
MSTETEISNLVQREILCTQKESFLTSWEDSLTLREKAILPIENILKIKRDAENILSKALSEKELLEANKKLWNTKVQGDMDSLAQTRLTAKREVDINETSKQNFKIFLLQQLKRKLIQMGYPDIASQVSEVT